MASKDPVLYTMPRLQIEGFGRAPAFDGTTDQPPKQQQPLSPGMPNSTVTARAVVGDTNAMVVIEDVTSSPDSNTTTAVATYSSDGQGNTCLGDASGVNSELGRKLAWLALEKQAAESRCRELEKKLAEARDTAAKRETSLRVASEKIRHMETESKEMLAAAEVREKEASTLQEGTREAQERAQAHEMALANALEQLSDSGVSQSKKLMELAEVAQELQTTKAALERAERIVFIQRQEADQRQFEENRRRLETDALRDKLGQAERKNTELLTKQAAGKLTKNSRASFGRSSTFCASFCSCFRLRPSYCRVTSTTANGPTSSAYSGTPTSQLESPWLV